MLKFELTKKEYTKEQLEEMLNNEGLLKEWGIELWRKSIQGVEKLKKEYPEPTFVCPRELWNVEGFGFHHTELPCSFPLSVWQPDGYEPKETVWNWSTYMELNGKMEDQFPDLEVTSSNCVEMMKFFIRGAIDFYEKTANFGQRYITDEQWDKLSTSFPENILNEIGKHSGKESVFYQLDLTEVDVFYHVQGYDRALGEYSPVIVEENLFKLMNEALTMSERWDTVKICAGENALKKDYVIFTIKQNGEFLEMDVVNEFEVE